MQNSPAFVDEAAAFVRAKPLEMSVQLIHSVDAEAGFGIL